MPSMSQILYNYLETQGYKKILLVLKKPNPDKGLQAEAKHSRLACMM